MQPIAKICEVRVSQQGIEQTAPKLKWLPLIDALSNWNIEIDLTGFNSLSTPNHSFIAAKLVSIDN
jgi:hypothetical protein